MRPTHAEVHQQLPRRDQPAARGLGRDQGLVVQDVDESALHELGLGQGRDHAQDRRVGEKHRALGHGVHLAGETQVRQPPGEFLAEASAAPDPIKLLLGETQVLEELKRLFEAGGDEKGAVRRQPPHEEFEHRDVVHVLLEICLQHGELVQVGEQRAFERIDHVVGAGWRYAASWASVHGRAPRRRISASALRPSSGLTLTARTASVSRKVS